MSVALRPPPEVAARLAALDRPAIPGVTWSEPARWLVKVRPLGHVETRLVPALCERLDAELDGAPAVTCTLGPATRRFSDWLALPVTGLDDLADVVFDATTELVPVTHPQPFQAWLTLAQGRRMPKELGGLPLAASWTARSLALVADRSSPGRARLEDLATFPLGT